MTAFRCCFMHALQGKVMEMQKSGELQKHWDNFQAQEYTASMVSC